MFIERKYKTIVYRCIIQANVTWFDILHCKILKTSLKLMLSF